jgi:hypothetical protein
VFFQNPSTATSKRSSSTRIAQLKLEYLIITVGSRMSIIPRLCGINSGLVGRLNQVVINISVKFTSVDSTMMRNYIQVQEFPGLREGAGSRTLQPPFTLSNELFSIVATVSF